MNFIEISRVTPPTPEVHDAGAPGPIAVNPPKPDMASSRGLLEGVDVAHLGVEVEALQVVDTLTERAEGVRAPEKVLAIHEALGSLDVEATSRAEHVHIGRDEDVLVAEGDPHHVGHPGIEAMAADNGQVRECAGDVVHGQRVVEDEVRSRRTRHHERGYAQLATLFIEWKQQVGVGSEWRGIKACIEIDGPQTEFDDGTAHLTGAIYKERVPNKRFLVDVWFTGRVSPGELGFAPSGSPKKELWDWMYVENGGPVDTNTWHYYLHTDGFLTGQNAMAGALIQITRMGPAFQVGLGANGKNIGFGASGCGAGGGAR